MQVLKLGLFFLVLLLLYLRPMPTVGTEEIVHM